MPKQKQKTRQTITETPRFSLLPSELREPSLQLAQYLSGQLGKPAPAYTGRFTAPMGELETGLLEDLFPLDIGRDLGASDYLSDLLSGKELGPTQELEDYISMSQRPVRQAYFEDVLPGVKTAAVRAGALTGTQFPDVLARTGRDYEKQLSDIATGIAFPAMESARGRRFQAAQLAPSITNLPLERVLASMPLAGMERGIQQADLDALYKDFVRQMEQLNITPQLLTQLLSSALSGGPGTTTTVGRGEEGAGALGMLMQLLSMGAQGASSYYSAGRTTAGIPSVSPPPGTGQFGMPVR